jgi:acyl-CoA thioester hydrolase
MMSPDIVVTETKVRVRYAETDKMGVVYHSNYIIWFEVGRVEMLRSFGFTYKEMESDEDTHLPVVEARCRYKAPALYDDEILVRTHLKNVRDSLIHFGYEVLRAEDNTLLAEGETVHLVLDGYGNRKAFPEKYLTVFKSAFRR